MHNVTECSYFLKLTLEMHR